MKVWKLISRKGHGTPAKDKQRPTAYPAHSIFAIAGLHSQNLPHRTWKVKG